MLNWLSWKICCEDCMMENISCTVWKYLTSVTVGTTVALRTVLLIDRRHQTAKRKQLYLFRSHEQDLN